MYASSFFVSSILHRFTLLAHFFLSLYYFTISGQIIDLIQRRNLFDPVREKEELQNMHITTSTSTSTSTSVMLCYVMLQIL